MSLLNSKVVSSILDFMCSSKLLIYAFHYAWNVADFLQQFLMLWSSNSCHAATHHIIVWNWSTFSLYFLQENGGNSETTRDFPPTLQVKWMLGWRNVHSSSRNNKTETNVALELKWSTYNKHFDTFDDPHLFSNQFETKTSTNTMHSLTWKQKELRDSRFKNLVHQKFKKGDPRGKAGEDAIIIHRICCPSGPFHPYYLLLSH